MLDVAQQPGVRLARLYRRCRVATSEFCGWGERNRRVPSSSWPRGLGREARAGSGWRTSGCGRSEIASGRSWRGAAACRPQAVGAGSPSRSAPAHRPSATVAAPASRAIPGIRSYVNWRD